MRQGGIRMRKKPITQIMQQNHRQPPNECREAITNLTEHIETKNSHRKLDTLQHLESLGLECKIDKNGKKTKG